MKNKGWKKALISVLLIAVLSTLSLAGCAKKFDAGGYIKSALDAMNKGEFADYAKLTDTTVEEVEQEYNRMLDSSIEQFANTAMSEELLQQYRTLFADVYKATKYEVKSVEQDGDNYLVEVEYEPLTVFDNIDNVLADTSSKFVEDWVAKTQSGEIDNEKDSMEQKLYETILGALRELVDTPTYGPKETRTMTVKYNETDKIYEANEDELVNLERALLNNKL